MNYKRILLVLGFFLVASSAYDVWLVASGNAERVLRMNQHLPGFLPIVCVLFIFIVRTMQKHNTHP